MPLLLKICGLRETDNIRQVIALEPDFVGFIFYPPSPRFVSSPDDLAGVAFPEHTRKIGVFVNELPEKVMQTVQLYGLHGVQLHGDEMPEICKYFKDNGLLVFKVFSVASAEDFLRTSDFEGVADYFLFDTKTPGRGGSGEKFDWDMLTSYTGKTSFLLSGGIGPEDVATIKAIHHPQFAGIDLNSRFEISPGLKNISLLNDFTGQIK